MQLIPALGFFAVLFLISLVATRWLVSVLTRQAVIDMPNHRSSHEVPRPRGGGIAVIGVMLAGWLGWQLFTSELDAKSLTIAAMIALLAAVSFADDLRNLGARLRLLVQAFAVAAGLFMSFPDTGLTGGLIPIWLEIPIAGFAWIWFVNLFNFMDGIDGITGVETICIGAGLLGLVLTGAVGGAIFVPALAMVAAAAGFLVWNWHPSRLFIGDVGSIPLGYVIGWMLIEAGASGAGFDAWAAILLLPGYYLFDATFTLLKRIARRENVFEAHRQHFYQVATSRGLGHAATCMAIIFVNLILIVLAWFVAPDYPLQSLALGLAAVIALCAWFRRGYREAQSPAP